ncbi:MAG: helix-turn-helix domain-containing protein [Deltaproteobacteria bacterium]|jgi:transcriptional regulator with XRE-family HTH domain|nr:helix-turn-helix domain-containing protein [Deltaproteobacteria bacterium]
MIINGPAFKELRESQMMSKFFLAKASGVSPTVINRLELSKFISPELMRRVLSVLNITPEEAFSKKMLLHS